ncbi:wall associated protein [Xanthomonas sp. D-109]|nr:wall associated protein [Xanthomonas sp. D-109]
MKYTALALLFFSTSASAQYVSTEKTYDERLRKANSVSALNNDLFGDSINLKDGTVQFSQTDVSLPINGNLRLDFTRHTPRQKQGLDRAAAPLGAGWEIDIPYMMGTYDTRTGWDARGSLARCSSPVLAPSERVGPSPDYNTRVMSSEMYWSGIFINAPGVGYESLLKLVSGQPVPQDGANYIGAANGFWRVSCMPSIRNGTGEGFIVRTPNGNKYYFDWMATRNAADVLVSEYYRDANGDGTSPAMTLVPTMDVFLYASKVEDRFGNYINYNFDPQNPSRLTSMVSSDGARIDVSYDGTGKVSEVRSGASVWRYTYIDTYYGKKLSDVALPDQSHWSFPVNNAVNYGVMSWYMVPPTLPASFYMNSCAQSANGFRSQDPADSAYVNVITMRHPSGAQGEFTIRSLVHGSDNTPGGCGLFGSSSSDFWFGSYGIPNAYLARSIIAKKISGPGIDELNWSYSYQPRWSFDNGCSSGCTSVTTVQQPDGSSIQYIFGNSYTQDFGDLLSEKISRDGLIIQQTSYLKDDSTSTPYPATYGSLIAPKGNPLSTRLRPIKELRLQRDGTNYLRRVNSFDQMGRPSMETKSSIP